MTATQAHTERWRLQYIALVNVAYYEYLLKWIHALHAFTRYLSMGLAIIGLAMSLAKVEGLAWALGGLSITILFDMLGTQRMLDYAQSLRQRWTSLESSCRQFKVTMEPKSEQEISNATAARLVELEETKSDISRDETWFAIDWLHRRCQRGVNQQRYAVKGGTFEEVQAKLGGDVQPIA